MSEVTDDSHDISNNKVLIFDQPDFFINIIDFHKKELMNDIVFNYLFLTGMCYSLINSNNTISFDIGINYSKILLNTLTSNFNNQYRGNIEFKITNDNNKLSLNLAKPLNIAKFSFSEPIHLSLYPDSVHIINSTDDLNYLLDTYLKNHYQKEEDVIKFFSFLVHNDVEYLALYLRSVYKEDGSSLNIFNEDIVANELLGFLVNNFYYPPLILKSFNDTTKDTQSKRVKNKI